MVPWLSFINSKGKTWYSSCDNAISHLCILTKRTTVYIPSFMFKMLLYIDFIHLFMYQSLDGTYWNVVSNFCLSCCLSIQIYAPYCLQWNNLSVRLFAISSNLVCNFESMGVQGTLFVFSVYVCIPWVKHCIYIILHQRWPPCDLDPVVLDYTVVWCFTKTSCSILHICYLYISD